MLILTKIRIKRTTYLCRHQSIDLTSLFFFVEAKNIDASIAHAKKLLLMGVAIPKDSNSQAWLRLHCRDELRNIAFQLT
jgi:hypothetical protein